MNISPELSTFVSAMLPITELRLAIPLGIEVFGLPPIKTAIIAILGNIVPILLLLLMYGPVTDFLMEKSKFFNNFFTKLFKKTRHKHTHKFNKYGALFLIFFVAVPLPGSGGWTGSLIAYLFGVPYKYAILLITIGLICSGIIVTVGLESIVSLIEYIKS